MLPSSVTFHRNTLFRSPGRGDNWCMTWAADGSIVGPLPVVDCAQKAHYAKRERQGRVVEVSARVAKERGFYGVGPVPVMVWFEKPTMRWN